MKKALFVLEHLEWFYNKYKEDDLAEFTIDIDDYNRIKDAILELNATCDNCVYQNDTKIIKTSIGERLDICKLCKRYEVLQDYFSTTKD